jgi:hypothetical protein
MLHETQMRQVQVSGLDDLKRLTVDSTAVPANSAWPSESALILGHLTRVANLLHGQGELSGMKWASKLVERWLGEIRKKHVGISLLGSRRGATRSRKALYRKLLRIAQKALTRLTADLEGLANELLILCPKPSFSLRIDQMTQQAEHSLGECRRAMDSAIRRVIRGEKVDADQKCYSVADPDAYMVVKSDRDPVVGYKPQIGRSREGFITCFEVERGNPADSERLLAMYDQCVANTGLRPAEVSTDDGYTSAANLKALLDRGVSIVSFSGAKGRKVLGEELWGREDYHELRDNRPSVESTIFTAKHKFNLRSFCRRGLAGVQMELAGSVFAFNLWRMSFLRRRRRPQLTPAAVAA